MKLRTASILCCLLTIFHLGCGGAATQTPTECAQADPKAAETADSAPVAEVPPEKKVDAVSAASHNHFEKPNAWTRDQLIEAFKNHMNWTVDMFFAMATVDETGKPNISSIMPYALRDDVLVFANRGSVTRTNVESRRFSHAIFRAVDQKTADPKKFDVFGIVGSRIHLELIDDPKELEILWGEYKAAKTPASPPTFTKDDHFFMRIVEIVPIG